MYNFFGKMLFGTSSMTSLLEKVKKIVERTKEFGYVTVCIGPDGDTFIEFNKKKSSIRLSQQNCFSCTCNCVSHDRYTDVWYKREEFALLLSWMKENNKFPQSFDDLVEFHAGMELLDFYFPVLAEQLKEIEEGADR